MTSAKASKNEKGPLSTGERFALGGAGHLSSAVTGGGLGMVAGNAVIKDFLHPKGEVSNEELAKFVDDFNKTYKRKVGLVSDSGSVFGGAFLPKSVGRTKSGRNFVNSTPGKVLREMGDDGVAYMGTFGKKLAILAHELGHAQSMGKAKGLLWPILSHVTSKVGPGVGGLVGAGMATSEDDRVRNLAPLAPIVASAPILLEEANASRHGYNILKNLRGKQQARAAVMPLLKAYSTYAARPAAAAAGALGVGLVAKKMRESRLEKTGSAFWAGFEKRAATT